MRPMREKLGAVVYNGNWQNHLDSWATWLFRPASCDFETGYLRQAIPVAGAASPTRPVPGPTNIWGTRPTFLFRLVQCHEISRPQRERL